MKKRKTDKKLVNVETDGTFLLKIVLYVILSSFWIKFMQPLDLMGIPIGGIPLGLFIALAFASREKFQIDRKIEYVVIIVITIVTFFIPTIGLVL